MLYPDEGTSHSEGTLYLVFHVDGQRYALAARDVVEVLPMLEIKPVLAAPEYMKGVFCYRNTPVPVIDFCRLACGRDAIKVMSTRILIINYSCGQAINRRLGLIAEGVTETRKIDEEALRPVAVGDGSGFGHGKYFEDKHGAIHCLDSRRILPTEVHRALFSADSSLEVA